jgi:hypothetical protein
MSLERLIKGGLGDGRCGNKIGDCNFLFPLEISISIRDEQAFYEK